MTRTWGRAGALVLLPVLLVGCTPDEEPRPAATAVPTSPAPGADLVCGMDRADVEAVSGVDVESDGGELSVVDGVGTGECQVFTRDAKWMMNVKLHDVTSPAGVEARANIAGTGEGVREPDVVYTTREGAIWGDVDAEEGAPTLNATSYVVVGDTLVTMLLRYGQVDRDRQRDQLALTEQIAATYGLDPGAAGS